MNRRYPLAAMSLKDWILSSASQTSYPAIRLIDGGVSTHLEKLLQAQDPPGSFAHRSLWSSSLLLNESGRETILQGHNDWLAAGSDILTTVTYQCHFGTFGHDLDIVTPEEMTAMMKDGVQLAQQAILENKYTKDEELKRNHFVVASSGCYGAALANGAEYTGNYPNINVKGLSEFHTKKAKVLLDQQPDGLAIETIPSVDECTAVCVALKSVLQESSSNSPSCCSWVSLACRDGETLNEGKLFVDALQVIREQDPHAEYVHAIGINCCDSAHVASLLEILTRDMALKGPRRGIVVYPNSGEEWDASDESWREGTGCTDADDLSDRLMEAIDVVKHVWGEHGGNEPIPKLIVGGCCRTTPETIASLRQRIDKWHKKNNI
jgi:homocysteine S-methyltransferase